MKDFIVTLHNGNNIEEVTVKGVTDITEIGTVVQFLTDGGYIALVVHLSRFIVAKERDAPEINE